MPLDVSPSEIGEAQEKGMAEANNEPGRWDAGSDTDSCSPYAKGPLQSRANSPASSILIDDETYPPSSDIEGRAYPLASKRKDPSNPSIEKRPYKRTKQEAVSEGNTGTGEESCNEFGGS